MATPSREAVTLRDGSRAPPLLQIDNLSRRFAGVPAVDRVSLDIFAGEFFSLLGASGSGKSTLLRLIAGLETPDGGRILLNGEDVTTLPPHRRPVNMMFQSYALFPHMTVAQNVAFGLQQERIANAEIRRRVEAMLALVKLENLHARKPEQLSGGQRQRVALARALVKKPRLLLLDEPLAALDRRLREHTRFELINIQKTVGITFVMVTHDQEEAMSLSSRIAVMEQGRIVQIGSASDIYEHPVNRFVAEFIGSITLFEGRVEKRNDGAYWQIVCPRVGATLLASPVAALAAADNVMVALRPEKLRLLATRPAQTHNWLQGTVQALAYQGDVSLYRVALADGSTMEVQWTNRDREDAFALAPGSPVFVSWDAANAMLLPV